MSFRRVLLILAGLAALAVLTYLPLLRQPFIADDYGNLLFGRLYGPVSSWGALAADPVHRYRPLFLLLTYWTDRLFGPWPPAFYLLSIALHVLNTWLVFALGAWRALGWKISAAAAAFFAVYEGHQEAVMWYSAAYELLLLLFALLCFLAWILWLQSARPRLWLYVAALAAFVLALFSKESAVAVVPLLLLPVAATPGNRRRGLLGLIPFAAFAAVYAASIFLGTHSPRLDDGSFSFRAPVLVTWLNSFWRLFWIWGLVSLLALAAWRSWQRRELVLLALAWIGVSLLPYSFLTYMTRVPSRQTYLASVGLAWIVAAGFVTAWERLQARRWVVAAVAAILLIHNIGYLWTKKREQYLERAAPTEALIRLARRARGPVCVRRFPYPRIVAQGAMELGAGKSADSLVWAVEPGRSRGLNDYAFSLGNCATLEPASAGRNRARR